MGAVVAETGLFYQRGQRQVWWRDRRMRGPGGLYLVMWDMWQNRPQQQQDGLGTMGGEAGRGDYIVFGFS